MDEAQRAMKNIARRYELGRSILAKATWRLEDELEKTPMDWRILREGRKAPNLSDGYAILLGTLRNLPIMNSIVSQEMAETILEELDDCDPRSVKRRGRMRLRNLLDRVRDKVTDVPLEKKQLWERFCTGAFEGAVFLSEYKNWKDFQQAVPSRNDTPENRWRFDLFMGDGTKIPGMRAVLACSFLKDSGFRQYAKPDRWIQKEIKEPTGEELSTKDVFLLLCETAERLKITPFALDKVLWLMNTGRPAFMFQAMREFRTAKRK